MAASYSSMAMSTTAPHPSEKQLKQTLKNTKYSHPGSVARQILSTIERFHDLKPSVKEYMLPNGKKADLMQLSGTIPVTISDSDYNIPVRVWILRGYPKEKPVVYLNPTADMAIASVGYVDREGKVNLPYLSEWKEGRSDLATLLQVTRFKFSQQCPVYTVRKTPIVPKSGSSTLPRMMTTGHIVAPQTPGGLTLSPKKAETSTPTEHQKKVDKMKQETEEYKVEINMLKSNLAAANKKISEANAQVEELKKGKETSQRGSFTSGLIDAMQKDMQQQIVNERQMKQKYKQKLDTMVTEVTQVREEIAILRVDKEDYQQRLRVTTSELQQTKKKMQELRNELSTVQGRFEASETNRAKEQAENELLRRNLKELQEKIKEEVSHQEQLAESEQGGRCELQTEAGEVEELKRRLRDAEEKLVLAIDKAKEIEKEKEELLNSFLAQISQTSLMEQQLFEEKEQLQLQLDGTFQQLNNSHVAESMQFEYDSTLEALLEADVEQSSDQLLQNSQPYEDTLGEESPQAQTVAQDIPLKGLKVKTNVSEEKLKEAEEEAFEHQKIEQLESELKTEENSRTEKQTENELDLPSTEAYSQVIAERDSLIEKLDDLLNRIKEYELSEKRSQEDIKSLNSRLRKACDERDQLRDQLEDEKGKSKLKSQLEAEIMETTCAMSQLTAEKVSLQFKVKHLEQQVHSIQEKTGKLKSQLEADISDKSLTVSQLTKERDDLLGKLHELKKQIREMQQLNEPQINDKDIIVSYEEIKLTQNMLGTGAWGYVVMGRFRGKVVAVKCLHKDILSRFSKIQVQREISIMAELRHPNLVLFIAAVLDAPSGPMIVTELLSYTLRRAYQDNIVSTTLEKISIMQEVALALNYLHLHHKPIIHRDISSTNVLLEELAHKKWRAKLSDFGSANLVKLATTPGEGALVYSAPEMRTEAHKPQSPAADVYSYGVLLCEVITNCFPDHSSLAGMLDTARAESQSLSKIVEVCLSENPNNRPSMGVVILQLDELINTTFKD